MRDKTKSSKWRRFGQFGIVPVSSLVLAACLGHHPRPQLVKNDKADALARQVMHAVGDAAWRRLGRVVFTFRGQKYDWSVQEKTVFIGEDKKRVQLDLKTGLCRSTNGANTISKSGCEDHMSRWNNDSFWLHPFGKLFDPGTERSLCIIEEAAPPWLCIRFATGGTTPGDLYAIELGPEGRPMAWRMWVKIIPIGGLHTAWSDWKQYPDGAWFAQTRELALFTIPIEILSVER